MQLDGKRVLITGAGSGIGQQLAIACAAEGARLLLVGRRLEALLTTLDLLPFAGRGDVLAADITAADDRQAIARKIEHESGTLDLLINNAGVIEVGLLQDTDDTRMERLVSTNLLAPMALTRELLPLLRASATPRIVNVGSVFGDIGHPHFSAYSATKFGLRGFSDAMRRELAPFGIGVTYVAPRATRTEASCSFDHLIEPYDMSIDSPETAAAQILTAIKSDARSSYARGMERLFVTLQRIWPRLIDYGVGLKSATTINT